MLDIATLVVGGLLVILDARKVVIELVGMTRDQKRGKKRKRKGKRKGK